jgi:putative addiction module killer protein
MPPNLSLNPDASPAALARRPLAAGQLVALRSKRLGTHLLTDRIHMDTMLSCSKSSRPTTSPTGWSGCATSVPRPEFLPRLDSVRLGNLGDVRSIGDSISEMRIDVGPGYRVYFTRRHRVLIILLCGGDKSTQTKDIARAKSMAQEIQ